MSDSSRLAHYHDLDAALATAWALLEQGARDRKSDFHIAQIATIDGGLAPSIRSVVLRGFERASRTLRFHSDYRSDKVHHIRRRPQVSVHLYGKREKVQLRLACLAQVHNRDTVSSTAWTALQPMSRACYVQPLAPGAILDSPQAAETSEEDVDSAGVGNFAVILARIETLEWLYLSAAGHRRARFSWRSDAEACSWVAP